MIAQPAVRVFLNDVRETPDGWTRAWTVEETITLLESGRVEELSLDHDLGTEQTGYDVVRWIEVRTWEDPKFAMPTIRIHSANPVGRQNMLRAIESILRRLSARDAAASGDGNATDDELPRQRRPAGDPRDGGEEED